MKVKLSTITSWRHVGDWHCNSSQSSTRH